MFAITDLHMSREMLEFDTLDGTRRSMGTGQVSYRAEFQFIPEREDHHLLNPDDIEQAIYQILHRKYGPPSSAPKPKPDVDLDDYPELEDYNDHPVTLVYSLVNHIEDILEWARFSQDVDDADAKDAARAYDNLHEIAQKARKEIVSRATHEEPKRDIDLT